MILIFKLILNMIFRDIQGNIIIIKKSDFINDTEYYKKIANLYNITFEPKFNSISSILKLI